MKKKPVRRGVSKAEWLEAGLESLARGSVSSLSIESLERLLSTAEMIFDYRLTRWEMAFRLWALEDGEAARVVRKANRMRLEYLLLSFHELGFSGEDAEMRAMTLLCYITWEMHTFAYVSRKKRRSMIEARIDLLIT